MEEHHPKKLLDQVRDAIRLKHYSIRTEQAYVGRRQVRESRFVPEPLRPASAAHDYSPPLRANGRRRRIAARTT